MKKILLCILFSAFACAAFSQMSGNYNYSIGIRGYGLMQMPKILNESSPDDFTSVPFNGVMVKFNDNQISYRISGTYYNKSKSFYNNCETCEAANGKLLDYSFKIGFEKNFNYAMLQPYFAFDLGYRYSRFSGDLENRNVLKAAMLSNTINANMQKAEASKAGLVLSPVIGIKINLIEQVSVFAESDLDFFYSYERQEMVAYDINNTQTLKRYNKTEFLLNPVSVGIQVHLGSNN